ncbi:MAG: cytidylate kinase-like family protein [Phycisphaerae bacterium]|nr:cytidylate kinase-like family protein [Phycisphaerae bacterium]MCZ2399798.1 cytidylate kinase-like family protein [Phycisphaerae bacterium]NUQ49019.1 cytidylate kinase-like family protein [Phycisphaerae bacterium]
MPVTRDIAGLVERQLRNWELGRDQALKQARSRDRTVEHFVAISRAVGAGGNTVGARLGERLGWPVFNGEILRIMAGDDSVRRRLYERLDEHDTTWLESVLRWALGEEIRRDDYFHKLTRTVLALARQGHAIFVGRAADLILPQDRGLRVRLCAPLDVRVRAYAELHKLDPRIARARVQQIDREREQFVRRHFGVHADDVLRFDMTLNTGLLSHGEAVEIIQATLRVKKIVD